MKDNDSLLNRYVYSVLRNISKMDELLDREKNINKNTHFWNKNRELKSIEYGFKQLDEHIVSEWKEIYNVDHFYQMNDHIKLLADRKSLFAKTTVQKLVEQYFYRCHCGLNCCIGAMDKNSKDAEADKLLWEALFSSNINEIMNDLYPYAMDAIKRKVSRLDESRLKTFQEINLRHDVDLTNSAKADIKAVPDRSAPKQDRKSVMVQTKKKYWLAADGTVKCPGDSCPHNCDRDCPIYLQTLAMPHLTGNQFAEAAKLLQKAVEIEPSFADAWNNLAACYGQMGDHLNAYDAYQRSFNIKQKPNPLYGMAVALKNLKKYDSAAGNIQFYKNLFGSDNRIKELESEVMENRLKESISGNQNQSSGKQPENELVKQPVKVVQTPPAMVNKQQKEESLDSSLDRKFGKLYLDLLDENTRKDAIGGMVLIYKDYPEAAIVLGQNKLQSNPGQAELFFKSAGKKGIAEAQWSYSQMLSHSSVLDLSDSKDKEYLNYCLLAAEGGCPDAANEMGNICYRKQFFGEATYWYGMAYVLDHPSGMISLKGITKEWQQNGFSAEYVSHIEGYTEDRHATSLLLYKMFIQSLDVEDMNDLMRLALNGENLAGFIAGLVFEQHNKDDMAYKVYNALAFENHPHALRCYADMLLAGKGTERDVDAAFWYYEKAARGGNAVAMFAMGQKAAKAGDKYMAACWFGQAYSRGFEMAGEWLENLSK